MITPISKDEEEAAKLENALSSKAAMRILRLLYTYPNDEFSVYRIVALAYISKKSAKTYLPLLVDSGLIKKAGHEIVTYRFNAENKLSRTLRTFLADTGLIK